MHAKEAWIVGPDSVTSSLAALNPLRELLLAFSITQLTLNF